MLLGYEQANRYQVFDQEGNLVALLAEDEGSLGKALGRQLLRTRRNFTATVFSPDGARVWRLTLLLIGLTVSTSRGGAGCSC